MSSTASGSGCVQVFKYLNNMAPWIPVVIVSTHFRCFWPTAPALSWSRPPGLFSGQTGHILSVYAGPTICNSIPINFTESNLSLSLDLQTLSEIFPLLLLLAHSVLLRFVTRYYLLTLSSPVMPNGQTSRRWGPYWSNPPFLFFWHLGTLVLRTERQSAWM